LPMSFVDDTLVSLGIGFWVEGRDALELLLTAL